MPAFGTHDQLRSADVVVVGGGTVGAWTAVLLAESGAVEVVLLEAGTLGDGASSRAAGMVRAQGGTETAIRLGLRSQDFYAASGDRFPLDCGFVAQGYLMPCFTDAEVAQAHERIALQRVLGLDVEWLERRRARPPTHRPGPRRTLGASYAPGDGYIDAPRNVLAYTAALVARGVDVRERLRVHRAAHRGGRVVGVDTSDGPIDTEPRRAHRRPATRRRRATARADGSPRAAPGIRWSSPHPHRASTCTSCRWCSTWRPGSTGGQAKPAGCCGA